MCVENLLNLQEKYLQLFFPIINIILKENGQKELQRITNYSKLRAMEFEGSCEHSINN